MKSRLIIGDCRDVVIQLPSNSVDVVILDPFFNEWDQFYNLDLSCLKEDGVIIAFSNRPHTARVQIEFEKHYKFLTELVWNFSDGRWVSCRLPRICHENIIIFTKGSKNPLQEMQLLQWIDKPKSSKKGGASIGRWKAKDRYYTPKEFAHVESVIYCPRNVKKKLGIVSKPEMLMNLLVQMTSKENDVILDLFAGSLTTAAVCEQLNRYYWCIDSSLAYIELGKKRLKKIVPTIEDYNKRDLTLEY